MATEKRFEFAWDGPGAVSHLASAKKRDPYDISTWGPECGRGIQYKDMGPVTDGQKGAIRKISAGRKKTSRGSESKA
jgi:hypothetical protein